MIQNNVVFYIAMLCKQYLTKKETLINMLNLAQLICSIIKSFCHDQLILGSHILQIMQGEDTLTSLSVCYRFAAELKKEEVVTNLLLIFNKYT